ncbi:MAG TPA: aminopeptidase N [Candidatus Saccharimonadales bacterium]|nr:aminopeptidase N [Candidatus Saccharimonadales bacterium]
MAPAKLRRMSSRPDTLTQFAARERAQIIGSIDYRVELDLTAGDELLGFDARVEFTSLQPGTPTFIEAGVARVEEIVWNGRQLPNSAYDGHRIALPELEENNSIRVRGAASYDQTGLGLHRSTDPVDGSSYIYSDFEPYEAHRTFPCFDQPDLKGSFRFRVRVPGDWLVVSAEPGSPEEADPSGGSRWWDFPATMPLAPYVIGLAAGPFHMVTRRRAATELGLYCAKSLEPYLDADELFEITAQGLDYFERLFRIPYPFAKYDQVFCPEKVNGAMESPGCVTITDEVLWRGRATTRQGSIRADLILHEMAHMWFGDLVTMRWWDDLWLNESFASLMANLAVDRATKYTDAWVSFLTIYKAMGRREDQLKSSHPIVTQVADVEAVRGNFDRITYEKGAAALRQLMAWVGEDNFFAAINSHLTQHRSANAEFADLVRALQATSGKDVRGWAAAWLETVGINLLRCEIESEDGGQGVRISRATVVQSATQAQPVLRPHRIRLGRFDWVGQDLERVGAIELDVEGPRTEVEELVGSPRPALLLPNDGDLTYAKIRLDQVSLATAEEHLSAVTDDLARALIWDLSWDMVRDLERPAHRFSQMVARHIAKETDSTLVGSVLAHFRSATRRYAAPRRAFGLEEGLAAAAWQAMTRSEPGSNDQMVWLRAFVGLAASDSQVQLCRSFFDGHDVPAGISVDAELRWALVQSLAARGIADEPEILQALAADPSSMGLVRAEAARAARPTEAAKAAAFARLSSREITVEGARNVSVGLGGVRHEELLTPYVPQLPQMFDDILATRGGEFTINLGSWLPASIPPSPELVVCCQENLARRDLNPILQRIFADLMEDTERFLRARLLDEAELALE